MKQNMKATDRAVRVLAAGLAVWAALAVGPGRPSGVVILVAAAVLAITGLSGFCPLYLVAGRRLRRPA